MKEEFEKFMDKMSVRHIRETSKYDRLQEAFLAGAAKGVTTMRERCAEVAENETRPVGEHMRNFNDEGYNDACEDIAAAIRKLEVKKHD